LVENFILIGLHIAFGLELEYLPLGRCEWMNCMSQEYEDIEDPDSLQQGDVIEWEGTSVKRPWQKYGIIITADCDLHREKHGGYISYIPAMITEDYLWYQWRPAAFKAECDKRISVLNARLSKWIEKNRSPGVALSDGAIRDWLMRVGPDGLLDELGCNDKGERNQLGNVIEPAWALASLLAASEPELTRLNTAYRWVNKAAEADKGLLAKAFQASLGSLPGDVFHLPTLPGNEDDGLFVMLRHLRQCHIDEIASRPDDLRFGGATAKRIARITATFRYALSQNFARVFSDIGLPEDHEERRKNASRRFFDARVVE
jgi:hypothetical protein